MDPLYFEDFSKAEKKKKAIYASIAIIGVVCIVGVAALASSTQVPLGLQQFQLEEQEFKDFLSHHGKSYSSQEEYNRRFQIYRDNSAFIRIHNSQGENWLLGVNEFADMSFEEFGGIYLKTKVNLEKQIKPVTGANGTIPTYVDWRTKGAVTPVKNQGQCGSCWAFSTTGSIEGAWFLANNPLISLSEQELVDCSTSYGNMGCDGGLMDYGFEFVMDHGITLESNYPYLARDGTCDLTKEASVAAKISNYTDVSPNNSTFLLIAISKQPVSVAVEANQWAWQFYKSGVIDKNCGTSLDHGVLAVGYDTTFTPPYYIVKNSWGPAWGESGYVRIGIKDGKGVCGIQMQPSYPLV